MSTFGNRLKKLRLSKGWTQEELGNRVNVTKVSISGYENNNRTPDMDTLQQLADALEVSVDYLLGRNSSNENEQPSEEQEFAEWLKENMDDDDLFFYEFNKSSEEMKQEAIETFRMVWEMEKKKAERRKKGDN